MSNAQITGDLAHSSSNSVAREEQLKKFMGDVREFGRSAAAGKDSLPMLAVRVVRAANDGIINSTKTKGADDDAKRIYEEFLGSASKKAIHDHTENGLKANVSKVRQLIKFGELTTCDPVDVCNRATALYQSAVTSKVDRLKTPYSAYVDVARQQLAVDHDMDDDAIKACFQKNESTEPDVERELKRAQVILDRLITGEKGLKDTHEDTLAAHGAITRRLAALSLEKDHAAVMATAARLGLSVVDPNAPVAELIAA